MTGTYQVEFRTSSGPYKGMPLRAGISKANRTNGTDHCGGTNTPLPRSLRLRSPSDRSYVRIACSFLPDTAVMASWGAFSCALLPPTAGFCEYSYTHHRFPPASTRRHQGCARAMGPAAYPSGDRTSHSTTLAHRRDGCPAVRVSAKQEASFGTPAMPATPSARGADG